MIFSHLLYWKDRISIFKIIKFVFVIKLHKLWVSLVDLTGYHLPSWVRSFVATIKAFFFLLKHPILSHIGK